MYHTTDESEGTLSYHCMDRNNKPCKIDFEAYDTYHNILYRAKTQQSGHLKFKIRHTGDIFLRFTNPEVYSASQ